MSENIEETNSGVRKKGDWQEIAEFGRQLEETMAERGIDGDSLEKFRDWRPKKEEAENDMKRKTVNKAVVDRKSVEERDDGMREGVRQASGKMVEAGKNAVNGDSTEKEVMEASEDVAIPLVSRVVKLFRRFESMVYSKFSLRSDRYYLDTEDFSVDMVSKNGEYEMDVSVPTESPREEIREGMED